jgi:hypothetical protein
MSLPALIDGPGRPCRIWTVAHLPVTQLPRFEPGPDSPRFVAHAGWTVIAGNRRLIVHRGTLRHELDGTEYGSDHDALRAAYGAGLLGVAVFEDDATRHGFPSAS